LCFVLRYQQEAMAYESGGGGKFCPYLDAKRSLPLHLSLRTVVVISVRPGGKLSHDGVTKPRGSRGELLAGRT
jgi:hypothetical protein